MKGKIISKISVKTVWGSKPDAPTKDKGTEAQWLMQIIGQATGFTTGDTDKGNWVKLIGAFQATNLETGELFRSGACFLPNVALNLIMGELKAAETQSVAFGFRIGVIRDEASATNYVYTCDPIGEVFEHDPLQPLIEKMKANPPEAEEKQKTAATGKK